MVCISSQSPLDGTRNSWCTSKISLRCPIFKIYEESSLRILSATIFTVRIPTSISDRCSKFFPVFAKNDCFTSPFFLTLWTTRVAIIIECHYIVIFYPVEWFMRDKSKVTWIFTGTVIVTFRLICFGVVVRILGTTSSIWCVPGHLGCVPNYVFRGWFLLV